MKNGEVKLVNNPVRDLSSVETFARQNTTCRRYVTSLFGLCCCVPTACQRVCLIPFLPSFYPYGI